MNEYNRPVRPKKSKFAEELPKLSRKGQNNLKMLKYLKTSPFDSKSRI